MNSGDPSRNWHGPAVACGLGAIGMLADIGIIHGVPGTPLWQNFAAAAVSLVLLALLLAGRRGPKFAVTAFLINNLAMVCAFWITDAYFVNHWAAWIPFRPHQLGIFTTALLAPVPLWSGLIAIAFFLGGAEIHWWLFDSADRARLASGQASVLWVYAMFGVVLLIFRYRRFEAERARMRAEGEAAALERLARTLLALRDLANTPLQTIEIGVALLGHNTGDLRPLLERIERAVTKLREGYELVGTYDSHIRWERGSESFDPLEVLQLPHTRPR
jgi:hypothetical protein